MVKKIEYNYFNEFEGMANNILESAKLLVKIFNEYNTETLSEDVKLVHDYENKCDQIVHAMNNYLFRDFLPPLEVEDINMIADNLDDLEDQVDEITINLDILNIKEIREDAKKYIVYVDEAAKLVHELIVTFKDFKKKDLVREQVFKINTFEEEADKVYEKNMKALYSDENISPKDLIRWTTIYNEIEDLIDDCEHLADAIEDAIMEI